MTSSDGAPGAPSTPPTPARTRTVVAKAGRARGLTVPAVGLMTAASVITSLRGLPMMAKEEMTMFVYIGFATLLFLLPAALVSAELGGAFAGRKGGVYDWVGDAFGKRSGFVAVWLQWVQNVVWYPTGLGFAAAAVAFAVRDPALASNHVFVGLFCIGAYWLATLVALSGTGALIKIAKRGFVLGTALPGLLLLGLFGYWIATGHPIGWEHTTAAAVTSHGHPSFFPALTGLSTLAFLAGILLLFAGGESQAVHVSDMQDPGRGYPKAMWLAAGLAFTIFTAGSLAVAGILPYGKITLTSGVFDAFQLVLGTALHVGWLVPVIAALIGYGALSGALAWIGGPSKALLSTAHDGLLPPALRRTNKKGAQRNILLTQGVIVTLISSIYLVTPNVSAAFFLISAMTVSLYIVMYLMLYAAVIRLRYTQPHLPRSFRIPGGKPGIWLVAGTGFAAVAFALLLSFVPPAQLPVGSPAMYIGLVAAGLLVFTGAPVFISALAKPSWSDTPRVRDFPPGHAEATTAEPAPASAPARHRWPHLRHHHSH
ncbi:amino acid permease [Streptomyces sp. NPDC059009]|uniref:amino acid permease n=1 Tax=Streptomyces sp. NPDC059009 TaxID=3346694 RepID=UPI0036CBE11A